MKKNLWIWAIAALTMTACTSEDVPTAQVTDSDWISPDGHVVVQLGAENTASVSVSRAPIEGTNITALKDLGIFALNRTATFTLNQIKNNNWVNETEKDILLMNVKAEGSEVPSLDPTVNTGNRIKLYNENATGSAGAVYYYPMQGDQNYNFYGYQPRTDSEVTVNEGKIQVTMTLDGDKDLITGITNKNVTSDAEGNETEITQGYLGFAPKVSEKDIYDTEAKGKFADGATGPTATGSGDLEGYNAKYIRKIKYHNWIVDESTKRGFTDLKEKKPFVPNLGFEHRLTKLNFQIITAKAQAGPGNQGNDREDAAQLRVKDVKLQNVLTYATLTIEPKMTLSFTQRNTTGMNIRQINDAKDDEVWFYETIETPVEEGEEGQVTTTYQKTDKIIPQIYEEGKTDYKSAGYLMVPATVDNTDNATYPYIIALTVIAKNESGVPTEQNITLSLKDNTFEAGKSYNIRVALYAQQEVQVSATLTDWEEVEKEVYIPVE